MIPQAIYDDAARTDRQGTGAENNLALLFHTVLSSLIARLLLIWS